MTEKQMTLERIREIRSWQTPQLAVTADEFSCLLDLAEALADAGAFTDGATPGGSTRSPAGSRIAPCPHCGCAIEAEEHLRNYDDHYVELTPVGEPNDAAYLARAVDEAIERLSIAYNASLDLPAADTAIHRTLEILRAARSRPSRPVATEAGAFTDGAAIPTDEELRSSYTSGAEAGGEEHPHMKGLREVAALGARSARDGAKEAAEKWGASMVPVVQAAKSWRDDYELGELSTPAEKFLAREVDWFRAIERDPRKNSSSGETGDGGYDSPASHGEHRRSASDGAPGQAGGAVGIQAGSQPSRPVATEAGDDDEWDDRDPACKFRDARPVATEAGACPDCVHPWSVVEDCATCGGASRQPAKNYYSPCVLCGERHSAKRDCERPKAQSRPVATEADADGARRMYEVYRERLGFAIAPTWSEIMEEAQAAFVEAYRFARTSRPSTGGDK